MNKNKSACITVIILIILVMLSVNVYAFTFGKELKDISSTQIFSNQNDSLNGISNAFLKYRYDDKYTLYFYLMCEVEKTESFKAKNCTIEFSFDGQNIFTVVPFTEETSDINNDIFAAHTHNLLSVQDIGIQMKCEGTITFKQMLTSPIEMNITIYDGEGNNSKTKSIILDKTFTAKEETEATEEKKETTQTTKPIKTTTQKTTIPKTTKETTTKKVTTEKPITTAKQTRTYSLATNAVTSSALKPKPTKNKSTTVKETTHKEKKKTSNKNKEVTTIQVVVNVIMPTDAYQRTTEAVTETESIETTDIVAESTTVYDLTESSKSASIKKVILFSAVILILILAAAYVIFPAKKSSENNDKSESDENQNKKEQE